MKEEKLTKTSNQFHTLYWKVTENINYKTSCGRELGHQNLVWTDAERECADDSILAAWFSAMCVAMGIEMERPHDVI